MDTLWTLLDDGSFMTEMSELQRARRHPIPGQTLTDADLNSLEPTFIDGELKWLEGQFTDGTYVKIFND